MTKKKGSPTKDRRLLTKKAVKPEPRTPESDEEESEQESRPSSSSSSEEQTDSSRDQSSGSSSGDEPRPTVVANRSAIRTVRKQVKPTKKVPTGPSRESPRKKNANASKSRVTKKIKRVAYKEIAKLQRTTNLLIPKAPFLRLVRELMMERSRLFYNRSGAPLHITPTALEALREAAECYLVSVFEDAYMIALHSKRVTLMAKDITLLMSLRNHEAAPP